MEHAVLLHGVWRDANVIANVVIVLGYMLVPFTVLRYLPMSVNVRLAGTFFFFTCATTHVSMAVGFTGSVWMVVNHGVQAVAVVWFVLGFWLLLRKAVRRAEAKERES